ncbi:MAG: ScyA-related TPP-binding enzyme [Iphinoe sp. HA4291-MV1]|jgi:acetolactate synthase-1/2/3 large subunit|nr:ScyA-related TPP-binding enzyme [Iphinoe sp. HA4291-MV1]
MNYKSHVTAGNTVELTKLNTDVEFAPSLDVTYNDEERFQHSQLTLVEAVVKMLESLGVRYAFGVSGGGMAPIWDSLESSSIQVLHFRHESGAAFAAMESYFADGHPVVVFTTTGPGITNALTGLLAARWEGAKVILLSACTSASQRGRWAIQETSTYTMPSAEIFTSGSLFHYANTIECTEELLQVARRLTLGLGRPDGFVAHLSIPTSLQTSLLNTSLPQLTVSDSSPSPSKKIITECAKLLSEGPFAIWVGFGARGAAAEIRQLAQKTGAAVMCSPRGKGIFPEDHPQFVGVTGFAGHKSVVTYMQEERPLRILVLGTRLGEFTSFWSPTMVPKRGFVHVDIDPDVPGVAYPSAETFPVLSDVKMFVQAMLEHMPESLGRSKTLSIPQKEHTAILPRTESSVRPEVLMDAIQRIVVEGSNAVVMAESGNSFAWAIHSLRFTEPGRCRICNGFGAMGHFVTGVVGAALARNGKAVAIVGDGAMLMNNEVNTAVKLQIPAVWIVLNDARYNMCDQGMGVLGFKSIDTKFPPTDFAMLARSMGADGIRVETESDVEIALEKAIASLDPFVIDVVIDPTRLAPSMSRFQSLIEQGATQF